MFTFLLEEPGVAYIPAVHGMARVIENRLVAFLTLKLTTEISANDLTRAVVVKAGKEQQKPTYCTVLVHKNDPRNASSWANEPPVRRRSRSNDRDDRYGRGEVGGNSAFRQRAFTIEPKVQLKSKIEGIRMEPDDADQVFEVVMSRIMRELRVAGATIGTGNAIVDSFGEQVHMGPFFEGDWVDREQGKALKVQGRLQIWYLTSQN